MLLPPFFVWKVIIVFVHAFNGRKFKKQRGKKIQMTNHKYVHMTCFKVCCVDPLVNEQFHIVSSSQGNPFVCAYTRVCVGESINWCWSPEDSVFVTSNCNLDQEAVIVQMFFSLSTVLSHTLSQWLQSRVLAHEESKW